MKKNIVVLFSLLFACHVSEAVLLGGSDGTINTTAPTGGQGWNNVGYINTAPSSSTYVSNNWFITANHVKQKDNPTKVNLTGNLYDIDSSSWTRITNSTGTGADLMMFRVNDSVTNAGVAVSSLTPSFNTEVTMIGHGKDRGSAYSSGPEEGYYEGSGTTMRWGTNTVEGTTFNTATYGDTSCFYTDFDNVDGEAQGVLYDSGGGVFVEDNGNWILAGITIEADQYEDQNGLYVLYKSPTKGPSETRMADLSVYVDQVNNTAAIPEPLMPFFLFFASAIFWTRQRFLKHVKNR